MDGVARAVASTDGVSSKRSVDAAADIRSDHQRFPGTVALKSGRVGCEIRETLHFCLSVPLQLNRYVVR